MGGFSKLSVRLNNGELILTDNMRKTLKGAIEDATRRAGHMLSFDDAKKDPLMIPPNEYPYYFGDFPTAAKDAWRKIERELTGKVAGAIAPRWKERNEGMGKGRNKQYTPGVIQEGLRKFFVAHNRLPKGPSDLKGNRFGLPANYQLIKGEIDKISKDGGPAARGWAYDGGSDASIEPARAEAAAVAEAVATPEGAAVTVLEEADPGVEPKVVDAATEAVSNEESGAEKTEEVVTADESEAEEVEEAAAEITGAQLEGNTISLRTTGVVNIESEYNAGLKRLVVKTADAVFVLESDCGISCCKAVRSSTDETWDIAISDEEQASAKLDVFSRTADYSVSAGGGRALASVSLNGVCFETNVERELFSFSCDNAFWGRVVFAKKTAHIRITVAN